MTKRIVATLTVSPVVRRVARRVQNAEGGGGADDTVSGVRDYDVRPGKKKINKIIISRC